MPAEQLFPVVYDELRQLAAQRLAQEEDDAEAALADQLQQLVRAKDRARAFAEWLIGGGDGFGRLEKAAGLGVNLKKLVHPLAHFGVAAADLVKVSVPLLRWPLERT
jgi:hypothetical protein